MKKKKNNLTKKQIIILTIITIFLGILCYFISTEITKSIIDHKTMEEKNKNDDFSDLREVETIENIDLNTLVNNYNENSNVDIVLNDINNNVININNTKIKFVTNADYLSITSINFNNKTKDNKEIIRNMIKANNKNINNETVDLIYEKVFETLGNSKDENSETSEFFQYMGLEFSLKEYKESDYKYSFRIGRIAE